MGWLAAQRAQNAPRETASGRVGKPRLARPLPPGLPPRVFRRGLALDNVRRSEP